MSQEDTELSRVQALTNLLQQASKERDEARAALRVEQGYVAQYREAYGQHATKIAQLTAENDQLREKLLLRAHDPADNTFRDIERGRQLAHVELRHERDTMQAELDAYKQRVHIAETRAGYLANLITKLVEHTTARNEDGVLETWFELRQIAGFDADRQQH